MSALSIVYEPSGCIVAKPNPSKNFTFGAPGVSGTVAPVFILTKTSLPSSALIVFTFGVPNDVTKGFIISALCFCASFLASVKAVASLSNASCFSLACNKESFIIGSANCAVCGSKTASSKVGLLPIIWPNFAKVSPGSVSA